MALSNTVVLCVALVSFWVSSVLNVGARETMPVGALICQAIEPAVEHARLLRQPTTAGLRLRSGSGWERELSHDPVEGRVGVIDVDQRGFALVENGANGQGWTDSENLWGYFDTREKVRAWRKP